MGASTCALGSHRCIPYSGILTRNARRQPAHHNLSAVVVIVIVGVYCNVNRERVPVVFCNRRRAINKGREPASV